MTLRVEFLALLTVRDDTETFDDRAHLAGDDGEGSAFDQVTVLRGAVEIVEHGDEALGGLALRALDLDLALLLGAAAVVGVFGLEALEVVQQRRLQVGEHSILCCGLTGLGGAEDVVDRQIVRGAVDRRLVGSLCGRGLARVGVLRRGAGCLSIRPLAANLVVTFEVLVRHDYFFSSSSSTTSASMTSSSEEASSAGASPAASALGAPSAWDCA